MRTRHLGIEPGLEKSLNSSIPKFLNLITTYHIPYLTSTLIFVWGGGIPNLGFSQLRMASHEDWLHALLRKLFEKLFLLWREGFR